MLIYRFTLGAFGVRILASQRLQVMNVLVLLLPYALAAQGGRVESHRQGFYFLVV